MNILHLQTELNITCGVTKNIYLISKTLNKNYKHFVIGLGGDFINSVKAKDIYIEIINYNRNSVLGTLQILSYLNKFCNQHKIDIVHSHHRYFDVLAFLLSKVKRIKTVTSVRSKVFGRKSISYLSKNLIAVSYSIKKHLINYFNIPEQRIQVINNFIDSSEINITRDKEDLKQSLKIPNKSYLIGYVGRLNYKEKGVDILLNAYKVFTKHHTDDILVFIGDGEDLESIQDFIGRNKTHVIIIPPQSNVYNYYNILNLVVLPSLTEAFGNVILEAGLMKKPFIGANVEGIPEIIKDKYNGLLFTKGDSIDLKEKLELFYSNKSLADKCANNLHKEILTNYTSDIVIPKIDKIYQDANRNH